MFYRFRKELIAALQNRYDVVLCAPFTGHEGDLRAMGIELIELKMDRRSVNPVKDARLLKEYRKILASVRPDLVITYSIKPNVYLGMLCAAQHIPYFGHVQGLGTAFQKKGLRQAASVLYKNGFRKAKGVFFENQANLDFFLSQKLISARQPILLYGAGVSLDDYPAADYPSASPFHFLYLGRIMREKGMDELIEALHRLRKKGFEFVFDFAGFYEDAYKDQLDAMVQEGWAVNHGFVQDPGPLYAKANCVVLPSWHEGMSNVLLEAASTARPLITSNIPGCKEAVDDGISGFLTEARSADSLYKAMKQMLLCSNEERKQMGLAGRRKMEAVFSRDKVVQTTLEEMEKRLEIK